MRKNDEIEKIERKNDKQSTLSIEKETKKHKRKQKFASQ